MFLFITLLIHLVSVSNETLCVCLLVCVLESTEGSESCGASEEEDERAGVVAAPALSHHPVPHPQQTWKGNVFSPSCHSLHPWSCNTQVPPLEGDVYLCIRSFHTITFLVFFSCISTFCIKYAIMRRGDF